MTVDGVPADADRHHRVIAAPDQKRRNDGNQLVEAVGDAIVVECRLEVAGECVQARCGAGRVVDVALFLDPLGSDQRLIMNEVGELLPCSGGRGVSKPPRRARSGPCTDRPVGPTRTTPEQCVGWSRA
jgi:hypothetical protein